MYKYSIQHTPRHTHTPTHTHSHSHSHTHTHTHTHTLTHTHTHSHTHTHTHTYSLIHTHSYIIYTVSLVGLEGGGTTRLSRFAHYLRSILPHADVTLTLMTAKAIGQLALAEGTYTAEYVEFEMKRALEWISGSEHKKLAAVSSYNFHRIHVTNRCHCIVEHCTHHLL